MGKSRSEACVKLLQELNPDVKGEWYELKKVACIPNELEKTTLIGPFQDQPLQTLLSEQRFTLLMYTLPIEPENLRTIQIYANENKLPLFSVQSAGFYSAFQIHLPGSFPIVDTHPEATSTPDMRLRAPWKELAEFAAEITKDIDSQEAREHGHIPYVALILHYLEEWKGKNGTIPSTYKDKKTFTTFLAAGTRTDNPEGGEENYEEAVAAVLKLLLEPELKKSVKEVFEHQPTEVSSPLPIEKLPTNILLLQGGSDLKLLGHSRRCQAILRKTRCSPITRFCSRHESSIECLCKTSEHLQGKSSTRRR